MAAAHRKLKLKPGDIYEDCTYHPVLCLGVDYTKDEIWGVSLVDGTQPRACSLIHCGIRRITPKQAWDIKMRGPLLEAERASIGKDNQWWSAATTKDQTKVKLVGPRKQRVSSPSDPSKVEPRSKRPSGTRSDA